MTNKQKFTETHACVKEVREKYKAKLEKQKEATEDVKTLRELTEKMMILEEFDLAINRSFVTFFNEKYDYYTQLIYNRRKRIQAVPICFLVTLYEQDLKAAFPKEEIQIPYTLRGFWKMEKAVGMVEEFIHLQNECQNVLIWEKRRLSTINKAKEAECSKILEEFFSMRILYNELKIDISYKKSLLFKLNKENVKLDVVPLCKLLTIYYARVLKQINHYLKAYAYKSEKEKFETIKSNLSNFMEKYFTQRSIIC